jgi:hypothetical protein
MPIEDPRRDGSKRDGLRIGGWLASAPRRRALPGRPPLVTPPPPRVPVFRPLRPGNSPRRPLARPMAAFARIDHPSQVRLRVAITCVVATAVVAAAFVVLADRAGTAPPIQRLAVGDPVTMGAIPLPPSVSPTPAKSPTRTPPTTVPATSAEPARWPVPSFVHLTTTAAAHPVVGGMRIGDTVSLEVQGQAGLRVRHQDFVGRVDWIGPDSSALDRADSKFVVHASTAGCVALESVNYPGFYLRNRDFDLHLDRADGSPAFRLDAALCPVAAGDGSFRLRPADYPDHFLTAFRSRLHLAQVPADRATAFAVRAPY